MEKPRYSQPELRPDWMNSSPYIRRIIALYLSLPGVKNRARNPLAQDLKTAALWESSGVALEIIIGAMIYSVLSRLHRDQALEPLQPIGSLRYFEPVVASYRALGGGAPNTETWGQLASRYLETLTATGWADPGNNWPPQRDPAREGPAPAEPSPAEQRRYQKKIAHRAAKWGISPAEAEARMIERARLRKPRQARLPRSKQETRSRARLEGKWRLAHELFNSER